jgi:hypothetical protein
MVKDLQRNWEEISKLQDENAVSLACLTEAQKHYVLAFRKVTVGMFCAARIIQTGLVSARTPESGVSSVLNMISRMAPIGGSAIFLLKCLVDKVNQAVMKRRIARIASIGSTESEVATLADSISTKIVFSVHAKPHKASHRILASMLSLAEDIASIAINVVSGDDVESFQIESTLFDHMYSANVDTAVPDDQLDVEEHQLMANRGEKDANALIAALSKQNSVGVSLNKLIILSFPTATTVSEIYDELLRRFHQKNQNGEPLEFATTNASKKKMFFHRLLTGFYRAADDVAPLLFDCEGKVNPIHVFVDAIESIETIRDGTTVTGLFYWKDMSSIRSLHIGSSGIKAHTVGWYKEVLESEVLIPEVIAQAANALD